MIHSVLGKDAKSAMKKLVFRHGEATSEANF